MDGFMRRRSRWFPRAIVGILVLATAACGSDATEPTLPVAGSYILRQYKTLPLPFYEYDTQERLESEKLQLLDDGTYELTWRISNERNDWSSRTGIYLVRGERIAFVGDDGEAFWLDFSGGALTGNQRMYFREDLEVPPRYRWNIYRILRCGDMTPDWTFRCPSTRLWLLENGEYRAEDNVRGATLRGSGSYILQGEVIELTGRPADRSAGTLRNDTLTLGTFLYQRLEWDPIPRDPS